MAVAGAGRETTRCEGRPIRSSERGAAVLAPPGVPHRPPSLVRGGAGLYNCGTAEHRSHSLVRFPVIPPGYEAAAEQVRVSAANHLSQPPRSPWGDAVE